MSDLVIHLTARAVEWLRRGRFDTRSQYVSPPAVTACGAPRDARIGPDDWCRTEDVRALVNAEHKARLWDGKGGTRLRDVAFPTCEQCLVLLDHALETPEVAELHQQDAEKTP